MLWLTKAMLRHHIENLFHSFHKFGFVEMLMKKTKIKEIVSQIRGVSYKPKDLHDSLNDDSVILLRANNIKDGNINFDDVVYVDKNKVAENQYLQKGDVLICASSGSKKLVGKAATFDFDVKCTFGAFCKVVRPQKGLEEYLGVYFQSNSYRRKISELSIGANINNIRNEHIDGLEVALYDSDECQRIVNILKSSLNLINIKKQEMQLFNSLVKSRFVEMFGDIFINPFEFQESKVSDYCEMTQGKQIPMSEQITEDREGYYRYLYINDLKYNYSDRIYVKDCYDNKKLSNSDLVVVNTGNTAGEIYRGKDGILSNNLFKVSFDENVLLTTYLFYYFRSDSFQKMLWGEMKEGTQPHLGHKIFGNKKLIIPPIEKQNEFELFVKQIDKLKFGNCN